VICAHLAGFERHVCGTFWASVPDAESANLNDRCGGDDGLSIPDADR